MVGSHRGRIRNALYTHLFRTVNTRLRGQRFHQCANLIIERLASKKRTYQLYYCPTEEVNRSINPSNLPYLGASCGGHLIAASLKHSV